MVDKQYTLCYRDIADPESWDCRHTKQWLQWAVYRFGLHGVDLDSFSLSGAQLLQLQYSEFVRHIPRDSDNIFWTHLELLKKYKFVGKLTGLVCLTAGIVYDLPAVLRHCWLHDRKGIRRVKKLSGGVLASLFA